MLKFIVDLRVFNKMRWENVEDHRPEFSPLVREVSSSFFFFSFTPCHFWWMLRDGLWTSCVRLQFFFASTFFITSINFQFAINWHWRHNRTNISICGKALWCAWMFMWMCVCVSCFFFSWSVSFMSNLTGRHTFTVAVFFVFTSISYRFFNSHSLLHRMTSSPPHSYIFFYLF